MQSRRSRVRSIFIKSILSMALAVALQLPQINMPFTTASAATAKASGRPSAPAPMKQAIPSPKACVDAAGETYTTPVALGGPEVATLVTCFGSQVASEMLARTMQRIVAAQTATAVAKANLAGGGAPQTIGYRVNGNYYTPGDYQTLFALKGGAGPGDKVMALSPSDAVVALQQQKQTISDTVSANAVSAAAATGSNNPPPPPTHCPFQGPSQAAANGGVALGAAGAIYTRTWVGILALLVPIVFAQCQQNVVVVNKPVLSPGALSIVTTKTATINAVENAYSGTFLGSSSDTTVATVTSSTGNAFTVTGANPGTAIITIVDSSGRASTATVTVTAQ